MPQKIIIKDEAQLLLAIHAMQGRMDALDKTIRQCVPRLNAREFARKVQIEQTKLAQQRFQQRTPKPLRGKPLRDPISLKKEVSDG